VLLISNEVFHYRVSLYNYLNEQLRSIDYELVVLTDKVQTLNPHRVQFKLLEEPFDFLKYRNVIDEIQPDVVILFLHLRDFIVWPLMVWMKHRKIKIIYWGHGLNLSKPDSKLRRLLFGIFHRLADAIILYSRNEIQFIADKYRDKIHIANNTLNFRDFPAVHKSIEQIKAEYNIRFQRVVLFVGRVTKEKRLDDLLDGACFLQDDICVVIVGGGLSAGQEKRFKEASNVYYLGEIYDINRISEIFKMADVFSIPGKMGLGVNQAMFWGLPVVTEDVKHSPEISYVVNEVNGFIVQKHNSRQLAEKINYLLANSEVYREFSKSARSSITQNANIDVMCRGFIEAIQSVEA